MALSKMHPDPAVMRLANNISHKCIVRRQGSSPKVHTKERSQMRHQRTRHFLANENPIEAVSSVIEMMKF